MLQGVVFVTLTILIRCRNSAFNAACCLHGMVGDSKKQTGRNCGLFVLKRLTGKSTRR
jgi:hypothetical protein